MFNIKRLFLFTLSVFGPMYSGMGADLATQYGLIKNVGDYSANPGFYYGAPYNQRFPQPVYVQGTDLKTDDCQRAVSAVVESYCGAHNDCSGVRLVDARGELLTQLSRLPGHNFATACSGFIDSEFEDYIATHTVKKMAFPVANTVSNVIEPVKQTIPTPSVTEKTKTNWQAEYIDRVNELAELQAQNAAGTGVNPDDFPITFADLSMSERNAVLAQGYEPYKDKSAYTPIEVEGLADYQARVKQEKQHGGADTKIEDTIEPKEPKIENPEGIESLLPWYGILVVKKGSLDKVANNEENPIVSSEYLKAHKDAFYPDNSDRAFGLRRACTHGNHMAHDKDVVNRATHITMGQDDSFWKGSDFYVYDGEDVYWGTAQLVGEIALALITFGISAEVQAGTVAAQTSVATANAVKGVGKSVKAVNVVKDSAKVKKAATTAKNVTAATKKTAIQELKNIGVELKGTASVGQISKIGQILLDAKSTTSWVSSLRTPWKLVKQGVTNIGPTTARLLGPGATWGTRFTTLATAGGVVGANYLAREFIKAFGYSTAALSMQEYGEQYKDVKFSGFGLLSDDNIEGRENEVSHGAWIQFEKNGTVGENDARDEALRWAEEFQKDMTFVNNSDPLCDVDIYVVQPAISQPKGTKREVFYILQNPGGSLRVSSGEKQDKK